MIHAKPMIAAFLVGICFVLRGPLESDPVTHILVQLPLLVLAGALAVSGSVIVEGAWNRGGVASLLVAVFAIAYWMLPRSIDAALASPVVEAAKFVSVPLLIGGPLVMGWPQAHPLLRGFLKAQAISMLGVLAFLYTHAPDRICNAYLASDQERLGYGFLFVALGVSLLWIIPLFSPRTGTFLVRMRIAAAQ